MAIMAWVFDIFDEGIRFPGGDVVAGNNTYTYVASFPVTFPVLDAPVVNFDTGIYGDLFGGRMRINPLGDDMYCSLDSDGSEMIPASGTFTVSPRTGNNDWGNWQHLQYGVTYPSSRNVLWVNFRMTGTPGGGGQAGTVTVRVYMKPLNTRSTTGFDSRPNGGNYPGSLKGV